MPFDGSLLINTSAAAPSWWRSPIRWMTHKPVKAYMPRLDPIVPTSPAREQAVQTLVVARALIEERKDWIQRRYETRDGRRCAVGALRGAGRLLGTDTPSPEAHRILLGVAMERGFNDIESMNDQSSHRLVITAFDTAITRASQATSN